jgi:2-methylisocitrate lyase-like PEP mutase family enzyme
VTSSVDQFARLHQRGRPLLLPNAWDAGSAKLLVWLGFEAIATTSSGHAATLGRLDGSVSREEALAHAAAIVSASDVPVSADLENCFADDPPGVAETVSLAIEAGLAGCSIEDFSGDAERPIYDLASARERVAAAAEAARGRLVLTARAENYFHGREDLDDTIARLKAYEEVGADVLYAPGLSDPRDIKRVVEALRRPVNVLARPNGPSVPELAELGVARVSFGGALAFGAYASLIEATTELRERGTYSFLERSAAGARAAGDAFNRPS